MDDSLLMHPMPDMRTARGRYTAAHRMYRLLKRHTDDINTRYHAFGFLMAVMGDALYQHAQDTYLWNLHGMTRSAQWTRVYHGIQISKGIRREVEVVTLHGETMYRRLSPPVIVKPAPR